MARGIVLLSASIFALSIIWLLIGNWKHNLAVTILVLFFICISPVLILAYLFLTLFVVLEKLLIKIFEPHFKGKGL